MLSKPLIILLKLSSLMCDLGAINVNQFSSVQLLSYVLLFVTLWIAACQASLSITNSWSLPKFMSIESAMQSSHLILCHPLLLLSPIPPSIRIFSNESTLHMRCQSIGVSASSSVLPMYTQAWSPLRWTGWICLQSKGLSRVFCNTWSEVKWSRSVVSDSLRPHGL